MSMGQWRKRGYDLARWVFHRGVIVLPAIGSEVTSKEVFVSCAMPLIRPALGDQGDLAAGGTIKVGTLVVGGDFEFLDGFRRSRHYARRRAAGRRGPDKPGSLRVGVGGTSHVVAV